MPANGNDAVESIVQFVEASGKHVTIYVAPGVVQISNSMVERELLRGWSDRDALIVAEGKTIPEAWLQFNAKSKRRS